MPGMVNEFYKILRSFHLIMMNISQSLGVFNNFYAQLSDACTESFGWEYLNIDSIPVSTFNAVSFCDRFSLGLTSSIIFLAYQLEETALLPPGSFFLIKKSQAFLLEDPVPFVPVYLFQRVTPAIAGKIKS